MGLFPESGQSLFRCLARAGTIGDNDFALICVPPLPFGGRRFLRKGNMAPVRMVALDFRRCSFRLRFAFRHNLASRGSVDTILVRAVSSGGKAGFSQILPRTYLTGETIESCLDDLEKRWRSALLDMTFNLDDGAKGALAALAPVYETADSLRRTASFSGVDLAVVDALCREAAISGGEMWGASPPPVDLVGVVSATTPRKAGLMAWLLRRFGYRRFKVKVGRDAAVDRARLRAVRRAVGSGAWLAIDANAAWTAEEALERLASYREFSPALVEEPLQPGSGVSLGEIEKQSGVAVMADESLCTLEDAKKLLAEGSPSWWNLRLGKIGGFSGLAALSNLASENGVKLYGGVLVGETSCLAAASRASMGLAGYQCMEYGFPRILVAGDPFRGGPGGFDGLARPLAGIGLGVCPLRTKMIW